jgi:uncharacterized PurR-regulated membrane protein YhhQ (DUF165 family)
MSSTWIVMPFNVSSLTIQLGKQFTVFGITIQLGHLTAFGIFNFDDYVVECLQLG